MKFYKTVFKKYCYSNKQLFQKNSVLIFFSFIAFLFCSLTSNAQTNPPEDVSFIVGATTGAPTAGTNTLVLLGTTDWNVRLYRGKLKQPTVNDGSGIWYTKNQGSDTIVLHGDTWHTGEFVQLEFYKPYGTLELGAQYVIQTAAYVKVTPWDYTSQSSPGTWASDGGGYGYLTTKKFTGDGYIQFKLNYLGNGSVFQFLQDDSSNNWSIEYHPSINSPNGGIQVYYNDIPITTIANSNVLYNQFLRLRRTGTTITLEKSTTENGVYTTAYTFSQSCSAAQALIGGGYSGGPGNGGTNCKIAGQSLVVVYN